MFRVFWPVYLFVNAYAILFYVFAPRSVESTLVAAGGAFGGAGAGAPWSSLPEPFDPTWTLAGASALGLLLIRRLARSKKPVCTSISRRGSRSSSKA